MDGLDSISTIGLIPITAMSIIIPCIQRKNMYYTFQFMIDDWITEHDSNSREIMLRYAKIGRYILIIQVVGSLCGSAQIIGQCLPQFNYNYSDNSSHGRNLPYGPPCWVPDSITEFHYLLIYNLLAVDLILVSIIFNGYDSLIFNLVMHLCGQFEILSNSIENFSSTNSNGKSDNVQCKIIVFLKRHNSLIIFLNCCEKLIDIVVMSNLLVNCFIICVADKYFFLFYFSKQ